jgi:hypothetical protein
MSMVAEERGDGHCEKSQGERKTMDAGHPRRRHPKVAALPDRWEGSGSNNRRPPRAASIDLAKIGPDIAQLDLLPAGYL